MRQLVASRTRVAFKLLYVQNFMCFFYRINIKDALIDISGVCRHIFRVDLVIYLNQINRFIKPPCIYQLRLINTKKTESKQLFIPEQINIVLQKINNFFKEHTVYCTLNYTTIQLNYIT